jgi:hypothetical protein
LRWGFLEGIGKRGRTEEAIDETGYGVALTITAF